MLFGLMSTMLKLLPEDSRCHRLIRKSSAEMNVSQSLLTESELMWYACWLPYSRRHRALNTTSVLCTEGSRSRPLKDPPAEDDGDDNVRGGAPGGGGVLGPMSGLWWWSSPAPW